MLRYATAATGETPLLLNITMSKRRKACEPSHISRIVLLIILPYSTMWNTPYYLESSVLVLDFVHISSTS